MPVCWGLRRGAAGRLAHSGAEPVLGAVSPYLRLCPGAPGRGSRGLAGRHRHSLSTVPKAPKLVYPRIASAAPVPEQRE